MGHHLLFIGDVVDARKLSDAEPLTYAYYHAVLKGKTPPKASSYRGRRSLRPTPPRPRCRR